MTASFDEQCSSRAIRSASSMSNIPNPCVAGGSAPHSTLVSANTTGMNLVLELGRIAVVDRHSRTVHMQLAHD